MPLTPQEFVSKWKRVTAREKQPYQEHFIDLCHLAGHQTPNDYDPTGTRFAFEMGAARTSGGQGWADVAKLGFLGWEHKGKDADLDKAYEQLLRYRDALQNPPGVVYKYRFNTNEIKKPIQEAVNVCGWDSKGVAFRKLQVKVMHWQYQK